MGDFRRCTRCDEFGNMRTHKCLPQFDVRAANASPDDWERVFAYDAKRAAQKYSAMIDTASVEWPPEKDVVVRDLDGQYQAFTVICESEPVYTACKPKHEIVIVGDPADEPESQP